MQKPLLTQKRKTHTIFLTKIHTILVEINQITYQMVTIFNNLINHLTLRLSTLVDTVTATHMETLPLHTLRHIPTTTIIPLILINIITPLLPIIQWITTPTTTMIIPIYTQNNYSLR